MEGVFMAYLVSALFWLVPTVAVVGFFISLFMYFFAKKKNKRAPGTFSDEEVKIRRTWFIIFSLIAGSMLAVLVALTILLYMAVAYM